MDAKAFHIFSILAVLLPATAWYECFDPTMCDKLQNIDLTVLANDNDIHLKWSHNQTEELFGVRVNILDSDKNVIYESPILNIQTRNMDFKTDLGSGKNYACVQFLYNLTSSTGRVCEYIKISDMKIVVGILAGVVFLVPCLVVLAVFIYKDKQIRKTDIECQKLVTGHGNDSFIKNETTTELKQTQTDSMSQQHRYPKNKIKSRLIKEIIVEEPEARSSKSSKSQENGINSVRVVQEDNNSTLTPTKQIVESDSTDSNVKPVFVIHV